MRAVLIPAALFFFIAVLCPAQNRFVGQDYSDFYEWFSDRSQMAQLYSDRATLYIFGKEANVHREPYRQSEVVARLPVGYAVENIAYDEYYLPEDVINGYGDIWYHVRGEDRSGKFFEGYVWGPLIAKGWRRADLTGDGENEFILLGVSSKPRTISTGINAEIRILKRSRLIFQQTVPGLCLFEECDTDALLRVIRDERLGSTFVEASTMTIGCTAGIEKVFFYWNGSGLERVFHAEYTSRREFVRKPFVINPNKTSSGRQIEVKLCRYSHEDKDFNPVWDCKTIKSLPQGDGKAAIAVKGVPKAR